eukprot:1160192-Pelagomonas_calceolata.AAC.9
MNHTGKGGMESSVTAAYLPTRTPVHVTHKEAFPSPATSLSRQVQGHKNDKEEHEREPSVTAAHPHTWYKSFKEAFPSPATSQSSTLVSR